ncbi:MAG TPA: hypothetical protein VH858_08780 [Hyphomicrobiales bacterium]|jgi:hypothetical protein
MNWYKCCAYDSAQKRAFHSTGRRRLKALADALAFKPGSFDLRSNPGGIAVSGEVTLHHERLYVQISQPATGWDTGILIRTCRGRKDYTGGPNQFAPLSHLDNIEGLAGYCQRVLDREGVSL